MSREYLGGCVAFRTTALSGVNMTGSLYTFSWESTLIDEGGPESSSGFFDVTAPTKLTVPTFPDNRKLVLRSQFNIPWNNVAVGTDWLRMVIQHNDAATVGGKYYHGGFEIANPNTDLLSRQFIASQGSYIEAKCQWRSTETSVDVLVSLSGFPFFEVEVLGYIY